MHVVRARVFMDVFGRRQGVPRALNKRTKDTKKRHTHPWNNEPSLFPRNSSNYVYIGLSHRLREQKILCARTIRGMFANEYAFRVPSAFGADNNEKIENRGSIDANRAILITPVTEPSERNRPR